MADDNDRDGDSEVATARNVVLCLVMLGEAGACLQSEKVAEKRVLLVAHSPAANLNGFMKSESMKRIEWRYIRGIAGPEAEC